MTRRTRIVATIGPASWDPDTLAAMIDAGMDMARVSLSHISLDDAVELIGDIAAVADAMGRPLGILADLPGPKVRAASFGDSPVEITEGSRVRLEPSRGPAPVSTPACILVDNADAALAVRDGDRVVVGDGAIEATVVATDDAGATLLIASGATTRGRPGVTVPAHRLTLSSPTPDDLTALEALAGTRADMVAVSFVQHAADMERARAALAGDGTLLMAKIETPEAVEAVDDIVRVSDGIMVARGDLGISCPLEEIPYLQRRIIHAGVAAHLPVITATQMLESMTHAPIPTRAEVTDVSGAVMEGTSAVMLSGETAVGDDPVRVIATMRRIVERADDAFDGQTWANTLVLDSTPREGVPPNRQITDAVSAATWRAAVEAQVTAIIACTASGTTARAIARLRPPMPVIAATIDPRVARQLMVSWGVTPLVVDQTATTDATVHEALTVARAAGLVRSGELVAVFVGAPNADPPASNTLRLVHVG